MSGRETKILSSDQVFGLNETKNDYAGCFEAMAFLKENLCKTDEDRLMSPMEFAKDLVNSVFQIQAMLKEIEDAL